MGHTKIVSKTNEAKSITKKNVVITMSELVPSTYYLLDSQENLIAAKKDPKYLQKIKLINSHSQYSNHQDTKF